MNKLNNTQPNASMKQKYGIQALNNQKSRKDKNPPRGKGMTSLEVMLILVLQAPVTKAEDNLTRFN